MASFDDWKGKERWEVLAVDPKFKGFEVRDTLTFQGDGTDPEGEDILERTNRGNRTRWGKHCKLHPPAAPLLLDYVVLTSGGNDYVIVRDTRNPKEKPLLWCFSESTPPTRLPPRRGGTSTVACWTAQDNG